MQGRMPWIVLEHLKGTVGDFSRMWRQGMVTSPNIRACVKGGVAVAAVAAGPRKSAAQQARAATPGSAPVQPRETDPSSNVEVLTADHPGSDFMVDVLKKLGFEYVCSNPGSSFRALHESLVNYGSNKAPEFITCCHEESSVGMAHGYAKIEGKP